MQVGLISTRTRITFTSEISAPKMLPCIQLGLHQYLLKEFLFYSYRLADLLEENQEELATIEALDSGAVYTLALKTHIGMSVQTFRYFAGWCDKIQVIENVAFL